MNFSVVSIAYEALESTAVRRAIGVREYSPGLEPERNRESGIFGLLQGLAGGLMRLAGFVWRAVGWLLSRISWTELWGTIQEATYTLAFFDWNQSDATIKEQIKSNNNAMAQLVGRFAGVSLIRLVSVGISAGLAISYPVVAGRIALELAADTSDELRGEFVGLLAGLRTISIENGLLSLVLGFRQRRWLGMRPIQDDKPYDSFAQRIENAVQTIPIPLIRNFVQGVLEGAEDAFWDVGYIVAGTLDDIVAANHYSRNEANGPPRVVKVIPDATVRGEAIVLAGPQQLVKGNIEQTIANHKMIWNRDIGQIIGIPAQDFPRAKHQSRILNICFKDKESPPWKTSAGRSKEVHYSIPDAKRGLTWEKIKIAAKKFTWGKFRATALLDNNRQMAVYGNTEAEAERLLRALLTLSTASLVTLSLSEEKIRT